MRPALPGELYEIFALTGVLYENLTLITGHCMEYTLACIWCYYYDDGLEEPITGPVVLFPTHKTHTIILYQYQNKLRSLNAALL